MEKLETERSQVKREVQKLLKPPSKPKKIPRSNRQSCRSSQILSCRSSQILSINNIRQYSFYIFLKFWIFIKLLCQNLSQNKFECLVQELSVSFESDAAGPGTAAALVLRLILNAFIIAFLAKSTLVFGVSLNSYTHTYLRP